jgi:hypothetical protein
VTRPVITAFLVGVVMLLLPSCTSSGVGSSSSPPATSPSSSDSPTPTTSSSAPITSTSSPTDTGTSAAAVAAYNRWAKATYEAERSPGKNHNQQLSALAVDPALGTFQGFLSQLQIAGIANRGTSPRPRAKAIAGDLSAQPYPTVTVVDCPTVSASWKPYNVQTGKPVKVVPNPVKPPYAVTAKVIKFKDKWVVDQTKADRNHTCSP